MAYALKKKWTVKTFMLNYKHVFSMEFLYKRVHDWLVDEGYCGSGGSGDKWMETLYVERVSENGAKEIWVWWRTSKMPVSGNPFFKYYLDVEFHVLGLGESEIVVEGTKVKTNKGEVEVTVMARMELDPQGKWDENFILKSKALQKFYLNRIYKDRIEQVEGELVKDVARLLGATKQYFQLESWLPEYAGKPFLPAKGE